jgi:hypothetical protein
MAAGALADVGESTTALGVVRVRDAMGLPGGGLGPTRELPRRGWGRGSMGESLCRAHHERRDAAPFRRGVRPPSPRRRNVSSPRSAH